jgi:hypothetical protein
LAVEFTGEGQDIEYFNSGCWTETPCTYLTVSDGEIRLCNFDLDSLRLAEGTGDLSLAR